ncbi:hypothetical protein HPP92_019337 [Vanilla planifolia]|uniref:Uncharacterized protein n=1 Tax=Vanilla planifolia TaxID=51239 RepID=A0A835UKV4_VANPL|nr:hypothetical protein HPP92_019337 [Vanilla planifolia]
MSSCNDKLDFPRNSSGVKMQKISLVASAKEGTSQKTFQHLLPLKTLKLAPIHSRELFSFIIKVAALETVRRFSEVRCPSLWKVVQAFQIFCYPPFKWLQRWGPLRIIVRGAQSIAKPVLLLSIATTFSGKSENCSGATARVDDSQIQSDSVSGNSTFDIQSEESSKDVTPESFKKDIPEDWQLQVYGELEKQGISLPERFNVDELNRFYAAANVWSHLVFGMDLMSCCGHAWSSALDLHGPPWLLMKDRALLKPLVLKPTTRKKLQIVGERNRKLLSDFLESVPAFLGGDCSCPKCRILSARRSPASTEEICRGEPSGNTTSDDALAASNDFQATELTFSGSCERVLRAAVVLILMLWVLIAFFAVTNE